MYIYFPMSVKSLIEVGHGCQEGSTGVPLGLSAYTVAERRSVCLFTWMFISRQLPVSTNRPILFILYAVFKVWNEKRNNASRKQRAKRERYKT